MGICPVLLSQNPPLKTMYSLVAITLLASSCVLASGQNWDEIIYRQGGGNAGIGDAEDFDALTFLERAGYLDDLDDRVGYQHAPDSVKQALKEYQGFYGLNETGRLDKPTVTLMRQPRCGVPDVIKPSLRPKHLKNEPLPYVLLGSKWHKSDITYKFTSFTRDMSQQAQRSTIAAALKKWSDVVPLTFTEKQSGRVEMELLFASGRHASCGAFDGQGGVLAHAFQPGYGSINGDVHFDDAEFFTVNSYRGVNLEQVAVHELGHAIGLGHSRDINAIMYPTYRGYKPSYSLGSDDIRGVQSLYGSKTGGTSGTSGNSANCVDKSQYCNYWARNGQCTSNPGYMRPNCRKACGLC